MRNKLEPGLWQNLFSVLGKPLITWALDEITKRILEESMVSMKIVCKNICLTTCVKIISLKFFDKKDEKSQFSIRVYLFRAFWDAD